MRIREFIPETWWNDLDDGFLGMMGYTEETQQDEDNTDLVTSISQDMKHIKANH